MTNMNFHAGREVSQYLHTAESQAVEGVFAVKGYSFGGRGQTAGLCFISLKPWEKRPGARNRVQQIAERLNRHFAGEQGAMIVGFAPPAALEPGNATGFDFELIDTGGLGHSALMQARAQLLGAALPATRISGTGPLAVGHRGWQYDWLRRCECVRPTQPIRHRGSLSGNAGCSTLAVRSGAAASCHTPGGTGQPSDVVQGTRWRVGAAHCGSR